MTNEEQHEMLVEILTNLVDVLNCDELSLLAHHLGIETSEFYEEPEEEESDGSTCSREDYEYGVWRQEQLDNAYEEERKAA